MDKLDVSLHVMHFKYTQWTTPEIINILMY